MRARKVITAVEVHAEGEVGRVVTAGAPNLPGNSMMEKMLHMQAHHDDIRTLMLQEPRGNPAICCNVITPPSDPSANAGMIIMEQTEYPPMSGSNAMCVATVLLETGMVEMQEPVTHLRLDTPAGLIDVEARCAAGKVEQVKLMNVPAFAVHIDAPLDVPGYGTIQVDIAWGGMFFVIADAAEFGIELNAANGAAIVKACEAMRAAATVRYPVTHPEDDRITGPTISQLYTGPLTADTHGTSAVSVSSGALDPARAQGVTGVLDRSPCGTGTCAKMAVLHAKGLLNVGEDYVNAGPLGTTFTGRIEALTKVGPYDAISPSIAGQAWIYGMSQFLVDPSDPFQKGYTVGDIWAE